MSNLYNIVSKLCNKKAVAIKLLPYVYNTEDIGDERRKRKQKISGLGQFSVVNSGKAITVYRLEDDGSLTRCQTLLECADFCNDKIVDTFLIKCVIISI